MAQRDEATSVEDLLPRASSRTLCKRRAAPGGKQSTMGQKRTRNRATKNGRNGTVDVAVRLQPCFAAKQQDPSTRGGAIRIFDGSREKTTLLFPGYSVRVYICMCIGMCIRICICICTCICICGWELVCLTAKREVLCASQPHGDGGKKLSLGQHDPQVFGRAPLTPSDLRLNNWWRRKRRALNLTFGRNGSGGRLAPRHLCPSSIAGSARSPCHRLE